MRAVIEEHKLLRSAIIGLIGESDPDILGMMEIAVRNSLSSDEDKVVALAGIKAIRETTRYD